MIRIAIEIAFWYSSKLFHSSEKVKVPVKRNFNLKWIFHRMEIDMLIEIFGSISNIFRFFGTCTRIQLNIESKTKQPTQFHDIVLIKYCPCDVLNLQVARVHHFSVIDKHFSAKEFDVQGKFVCMRTSSSLRFIDNPSGVCVCVCVSGTEITFSFAFHCFVLLLLYGRCCFAATFSSRCKRPNKCERKSRSSCTHAWSGESTRVVSL